MVWPVASNWTRSPRASLLADVALAVAAFGASVALLAVGGNNGHSGSPVDALTLSLTALASLPLVARRAAPLPVFVVTALASTALQVAAEPVGPPVGPTLALYFVAAAGPGSRSRIRMTLAVTAVLLAAHVTARGLASHSFPGVEIAFGVLVWGGIWLAGDRARLRRERLAELEERALRAEREAERDRRLAAAEERARIARDLHDSAGHAINVILVHAGLGRMRAEADGGRGREEFEIIEQVARETVGEIDAMVGALREDGATGDVEPPAGLAALDGLVERHGAAGLDVTTTVHGRRHAVPPRVDRGAYRILQEALTNAARHGEGDAHVDLSFDAGALELTVGNALRADRNGRTGGGHGLVGMRERATLLGGSLEAGSHDGCFEVHARLPLVAEGA
jgi:signal transduction histidine kinase